MDGSKPDTDTTECILGCNLVGGRSAWAEAGSKEPVDRVELRILPVVAT